MAGKRREEAKRTQAIEATVNAQADIAAAVKAVQETADKILAKLEKADKAVKEAGQKALKPEK